MSSVNNYGAQRVTLDFKSPLKGSYFTEQLYSIIKPGVYKGLEVSIAQINTGGNKVDITKGQALLNCIFELETTRSVKVQFQTDIKSYLIEQSVPNKNEIVYLIYEYQEVTENWVEILSCSEDTIPPANAIILAECIYDINGDIIDISYSKRQNGLLNSDDNYSLNDDNIFSNVLDSTKKFKFSASGISGTDIVRTINIPDHDYSLNTIPNWIVDTKYKEKEVIVFENSLYRCVTEHTSLDFFSELNSLYWESITSILEKTIVKGYNNTGSQLNSGKVIKLAGDFPTQEIPEISLVSDYLDEPYGVIVDNISDLNTGKIIQRGRLELFGIYDFSSGSIGQKIYCDNSGNLTLTITQLIVGQLLDPINTIVYIAILPAEEGLNVINFDGQLSVNETSVQKAFDRLDDYGYTPIWVTGKSYRVGNSITNNGVIYSCLISHIAGTFLTDLNSSKWLKIQSALDVSNLNGQFASGVETTYQQVIDRIDDYGYFPIWLTGKSYRVGNAVRRVDDGSNSAWICISNHTSTSFVSNIANWVALTDSTSFKNANAKNLISSNSNISVSGGTTSTLQDVELTLNPNLTLETITLKEILFNSLNTISTSGQINNLANDNYTYLKLSNATSLTGLVSSSQNKILIISNTSASGLTVVNESTASIPSNRIITGKESDLVLASNASIFLIYDSNSSRWRIIGGSGSGGLNVNSSIISSDYSILLNELIFVDTSGGSINITLPSSPVNGDRIAITDIKYYSSINNIVILRNGKKINNLSQNFTLDIDGSYIELVYDSINSNWIISNLTPSLTPSLTPTGIMPIGSELFFENFNPDTPAPSSEFVQANGQIIADPLSPYNGKRIRNLNGATITAITITAVDDTLKTFTVSLNDVYALMVGDSLTPDISVPNAVVKSVDYTTGVIEVGDFTSWTSNQFGVTASTLIGATLLDVVGLKRFARGNSSNTGGGGINTLQGFNVNGYLIQFPPTSINFDPSGSGSGLSDSGYPRLPESNGVNGTPRTANETSPNYTDGVWLKKIK